MTEQEKRSAVVREALSFEKTAYHHMGRLKCQRDADGNIIERGGVDCAQFPYLVYRSVGLIPQIDLTYYSETWFLHRSEELYLNTVRQYAHEVAAPKFGDLAAWKMGHCFAHGAIVLDRGWPHIIHALKAAGGVTQDHGDGGFWADRPVKFFSIW